jgi:hypothetical protein
LLALVQEHLPGTGKIHAPGKRSIIRHPLLGDSVCAVNGNKPLSKQFPRSRQQ